MKQGFWLWREDVKRKTHSLIVALFVFSTFLPGVIGLAAPQNFARPGAGISRLPLDVFTLDTPGFGDVQDAINLATGSVYVSLETVNRDNIVQGGDGTGNTMGNTGTGTAPGGWNLTPRMRLQSYAPTLTSTTLPNSFFLERGDSSGQNFTKRVPLTGSVAWTNAPFDTAPSWIKRYQNATPTTNYAFYTSDDQPGLQAFQEWIVVVFAATGKTVAHYYTREGTRYTFWTEGEYLDFVQNLNQQYRSAVGGRPEGRAVADLTLGPVTDLMYTTSTSGRIERISDEWGRVSRYVWNTNELTDIYHLLQNVNDLNTWTRKTKFEYATKFGQRVITRVTYSALDGWGFVKAGNANVIERQFDFDYIASLNTNSRRVLLRTISRQVPAGSVTTRYTYDTLDRITTVEQYNTANATEKVEPDITYSYGDKPYYWIHGLTGSTCLTNDLLAGFLGCNLTSTTNRQAVYTVPNTGTFRVILRARGVPTGTTWPAIKLQRTSGSSTTTLQTITTTATVFKDYDFGSLSLLSNDKLTFIYNNPGTNRTLQINGLRLEPSGTNRVVTVTQGPTSDPNHKQTRYTFDTQGQITTEETRDYNPWVADNTWVTGHTPILKTLTKSYDYYANGQIKSITYPGTDTSNRRVDYTYDSRGNLTEKATFKGAETLPTRKTVWTYSDENLISTETIPGQSGAAGGVNFAYEDRKVTNSYTYRPTHTVNGQTFKDISSIGRDTSLVSGTGVPSSQFTFTETFDSEGRLSNTVRSGAGSIGVQTTNLTYHDGNIAPNYLPRIPLTDGTDSLDTTGVAKQYRDQPYLIETNGYQKYFYYDANGNPIYEVDNDSFVKGFSGTAHTAETAKRQFWRSYNGFGQLVWEKVSRDDTSPETVWAKRVNHYHPTGELEWSWEGSPSNITYHSYNISGKDIGRVWRIKRGTAINASFDVDNPVEQTTFDYDSFGRVSVKGEDDFYFDYRYDTLDRVVEETNSGLGQKWLAYSFSGPLAFECDSMANARRYDAYCQYKTVDELGRVTDIYHATNNDDLSFSQVNYFDNFDREVAVEMDSLESINNTSFADRTTYMVYDSFGRLIKKLDPPLRTKPFNGTQVSPGYTDTRRPYTEYEYDKLGRKTKEKVLVSGTVTVSGGALTYTSPSYSTTTIDTYNNLHDAPTKITDPLGYTTEITYDKTGNPYFSKKQVWDATQQARSDYSEFSDGFTEVGYRKAFDGMGRVVQAMDPKAFSQFTTYDLLGNITSETDERGVVVKTYEYTTTGLLSRILEPDTGGSGPLPTKKYTYGTRKYPTQVCSAHQNNDASSTSAACTSYVYDWAGRPLTTTLPDNTVISQDYDSRGNLNQITDAQGFVTEYTHDAFDRVILEVKLPRAGTVDLQAGGTQQNPGLKITKKFVYDKSGNLIRSSQGTDSEELITDYEYNTLGKAIAETLPHKSGAAVTPKLEVYNPAGWLTAETTYNYAGNLRGTTTPGNFSYSSLPTATAGNVIVTDYDLRGDKSQEVSYGQKPGAAVAVPEYTVSQNYDGLRQRYRRLFGGDLAVYAVQRKTDGTSTLSALHYTYSKLDANGNILASFDIPAAETLNDGNKQNWYTFSYSPTNKETSRIQKVNIRVRPSGGGSSPSSARLVAASDSSISTTYNPRDLISGTTVNDSASNGSTASQAMGAQTTSYTYHKDGSKNVVTVNGGPTTTYSYDTRGRVTSVVDSNGISNPNDPAPSQVSGPATISTTYATDGTATEQVTINNQCYFSRKTIPTVGGLTYKSEEKTTTWTEVENPNTGATTYTPNWCAKTDEATSKFDSAGLVTSRTVPGTNAAAFAQTSAPGSLTQGTYAYTYDSYGNPTNLKVTFGVPTLPNQPSPGPYDIEINSFDGNNIKTSSVRISYGVEEYGPEGQYRSINDSTISTTYTLDSRGNRLTFVSSTDPYRGYSKRYNAEGKVSEFVLPSSSPTIDALTYFRYDPMGSQVLSTTGRIGWTGSGASVSVNLLEFASYTNLGVAGDMEVIRKYGVEGTAVKNETFTLADGKQEQVWEAFSPFSVRNPSQVLQAPTAPFSVQTKVTTGNLGVLDVKAPSAQDTTPPGTTPTIPANGEVKPPAKAETPQIKEAQGQKDSGFGIGGSGTIAPLPGLPGLGNPQDKQDTDAQAEESQGFGLKPPSNVLPPTLQSLDTKAVTAPIKEGDTSNPLPGTTPKPDEVKQPDQTTTPGVGTNPNDTPGIKPPETSALLPPSIPKIGEKEPNSISVVQAPVGWQKDKQPTKKVEATGIIVSPTELFDFWFDHYSVTLEADYQKKEREAKRSLGKSPEEIAAEAAERAFLEIVDRRYSGDSNRNVKMRETAKAVVEEFDSLTPGQKVAAYRNLFLGADAVANMPYSSADPWRFFDASLESLSKREPGTKEFRNYLADLVEKPRQVARDRLVGLAVGMAIDAVPVGRLRGLLSKSQAAEYRNALKTLGDRRGISGSVHTAKSGEMASDVATAIRCGNSFTPDTKVATASGLVAIGTLTKGIQVLAFNEKTGKNEYQPILEVISHGSNDQGITFLTLKDDETNREEFITTTPGHPFYLQKNVDNSQRPAPKGHEGLKQPWVGAGDLKLGDKVRQSDGTTGTVILVRNIQENRTMYNLDVAVADTFFVGDGQWLVHNTDCPLAWVNGQETTNVSADGLSYANTADALFRSLKGNWKSSANIAVGNDGNKLVVAVNSGINPEAAARIKSIADARGWGFVYKPELGHALAGHSEVVLNEALGVTKSIGVSHVNGPCPGCREGAFAKSPTEIVYTGKVK